MEIINNTIFLSGVCCPKMVYKNNPIEKKIKGSFKIPDDQKSAFGINKTAKKITVGVTFTYEESAIVIKRIPERQIMDVTIKWISMFPKEKK